MDFAETKQTVILFIYKSDLDKSTIYLKDSKTLKLDNRVAISLYKDVKRIISISENKYCVEIILEKAVPLKWYTINGPTREQSDKTPTCDIEEETEPEDVLALLSRIYENGDDDTRRAMEKSFIESEGTVLSTNWKEVKDGKVEYKDVDNKEK